MMDQVQSYEESMARLFWCEDKRAVDLMELVRHLGPHAVVFQQCHEWECELEILSAMGKSREGEDAYRYISMEAAIKFVQLVNAKELRRAIRRHARRTKYLSTASREDGTKLVEREASRLSAIRECDSEDQMRHRLEELRSQPSSIASSTLSSVPTE